MASFAVVDLDGSLDFDVQRMDLNIWVLPGIFRTNVVYCDIGLRLQVKQRGDASRLEFDVVMPFQTDDSALIDLIPLMRDKPEMCQLIFGDAAAVPTNSNGVRTIHDDSGSVRLQSIDVDSCKLRGPGSNEHFTVWKVTTGGTQITNDEQLYLRFRLRIKNAERTWSWQRSTRRRSHAIADLRVNEFRDMPAKATTTDLLRSKDISRVNAFVINQARLKAGRVNPAPKYVRTLEGRAWEPYLQRRLSRPDEIFVITYWATKDVTPERPFRSFLEVEKRRVSSAKWAMLSAIATCIFILLIAPSASLDSSYIGRLLTATKVLIGTVSLAVLLAIWKVFFPLVSKYVGKIPVWRSKAETRWYRSR